MLSTDELATIARFASNRYNAAALAAHIIALKMQEAGDAAK